MRWTGCSSWPARASCSPCRAAGVRKGRVVTATSDDELRTGMAEPGAARSAARVARATAGAWAAVTLVAVAAMILTGLAWGALATSALTDNVRRVWSCGFRLWPSPALLALGADAGALAALGGQDVGVAGVGVAPSQVGLQPPAQHRMVRVVGVPHDEGPQRPELGLDRVSPRCAGRREAQLDVRAPGPGPDGRGLVRGQVVHDHEQPVPAGPGGADGLERGEGVVAALAAAGHAPQLVIGQGVAAVEVADAVRAVVGRGQPGGLLAACPGGAVAGPDR